MIQAEIIRLSAEEHVRNLVLLRGHRQFVFMTQHPRPAVGPFEEVAQSAMFRIRTRVQSHLHVANPIAARGFPAAPRGAQKDAAAGSA